MDRSVSPVRGAVFVGAVLVAATVIGAALVTDDSSGSPPSPDGVAEQYRSLDAFQATQVQTTRFGNDTRRTVRRVTIRPGTGQYRAVALEQGNGSSLYDLIVSNGSVQWLYDRDNGTARRITVEDGRPTLVTNGTSLERLVTAAVNDTGDGSEASALPSVSPLGSGSTESSIDLPTFRGTVEYVGTDQVEGRRTYVFSSSLNQTAAGNASFRLWLDATHFVPLQRRGSFTFDGQRVETTLRYRNVSFDPDLEGVSFEFDPPENVSVEAGAEVSSFDSRAALSRNTSLPVPDPDVPKGFELEDATLVDAETTAATVRYENDTARVTVSITNESSNFDVNGTRVRVGDRNARLSVFGGTTLVTWNCSDRSTIVTGTVSNATLLGVAESVGCGQSRVVSPPSVDPSDRTVHRSVRDGERRTVAAPVRESS